MVLDVRSRNLWSGATEKRTPTATITKKEYLKKYGSIGKLLDIPDIQSKT